jgi:hypothetical protein
MNKILCSIVFALVLSGCATSGGLQRRADFGAAYTPFAEFTHDTEVKDGQLVSYTLRARDIIPNHMPAVNKALEAFESKCLYGVKEKKRREERRRNPAIDPYNRNLSAAIWGVVEQPTLVNLEVRFVCNLRPGKK